MLFKIILLLNRIAKDDNIFDILRFKKCYACKYCILFSNCARYHSAINFLTFYDILLTLLIQSKYFCMSLKFVFLLNANCLFISLV